MAYRSGRYLIITMSPSWNSWEWRCSSTAVLTLVLYSVSLSRTCWWSTIRSVANVTASVEPAPGVGRGRRSTGKLGSFPVVMRKGEYPVARCSDALYANSARGSSSSQAVVFPWTRHRKRFPKVRLVTSICPSVCG